MSVPYRLANTVSQQKDCQQLGSIIIILCYMLSKVWQVIVYPQINL